MGSGSGALEAMEKSAAKKSINVCLVKWRRCGEIDAAWLGGSPSPFILMDPSWRIVTKDKNKRHRRKFREKQTYSVGTMEKASLPWLYNSQRERTYDKDNDRTSIRSLMHAKAPVSP